MSCGECDVISLYCMCFSVNGYVSLVCCVFVNCLVKQFAICLGVVDILLLNVMEVFSVGGGALLDRPCMVFQIMDYFSDHVFKTWGKLIEYTCFMRRKIKT